MLNMEEVKAVQEIMDIKQVEFIHPCPDKYRCSVCNVVSGHLWEAACSHIFCSTCIFDDNDTIHCLRHKTSCQKSELKEYNWEAKILSLEAYCINKDKGCNSKQTLQELKAHLNRCGFSTLRCPQGCGTNILRRELHSHLQKQCQHRLVPCEHCDEYMSADEFMVHENYCRRKPMSCRYCQDVACPREEIEMHEAECPMRPRECDCSKTLKTQAMITATQEQLKHLEDVITATQADFQCRIEKVYTQIHQLIDKSQVASSQRQELQNQITEMQEKSQTMENNLLQIVEDRQASGDSNEAKSVVDVLIAEQIDAIIQLRKQNQMLKNKFSKMVDSFSALQDKMKHLSEEHEAMKQERTLAVNQMHQLQKNIPDCSPKGGEKVANVLYCWTLVDISHRMQLASDMTFDSIRSDPFSLPDSNLIFCLQAYFLSARLYVWLIVTDYDEKESILCFPHQVYITLKDLNSAGHSITQCIVPLEDGPIKMNPTEYWIGAVVYERDHVNNCCSSLENTVDVVVTMQ